MYLSVRSGTTRPKYPAGNWAITQLNAVSVSVKENDQALDLSKSAFRVPKADRNVRLRPNCGLVGENTGGRVSDE